jgi:hypothetical protein
MSPRISGLYNLENDVGPYSMFRPVQKAGSLARRPDLADPKVGANLPIQSIEWYAETLNAHKRTHEYGTYTGWAAAALQIEYFASHQEEASQSREKPAQDVAPLWRRLSYCMSFMQQGKVQGSISCAPPNHHLSLHPQSPPECRRVLSVSVGEMESVPVLSTRSPRDVAPRRAVTASASNVRKEKLSTIASVPLASYAGALARRVGGKRKGRGWWWWHYNFRDLIDLPSLCTRRLPSHFPIHIYFSSFSQGHVQYDAARASRKQPLIISGGSVRNAHASDAGF